MSESFAIARIRNGTFPYMLSARWRRRRPFCLQRNTTSRENPKGRLERVLPDTGKFLSGRRASAPAPFCTKGRARRATKRVRERCSSPGRARLVKLFPSRTERNFYPISTAASGIKRLRARVSMGFRKMFSSTERKREGSKEERRRRERERLTINCIPHWLLIKS